MDVVWLKRDVRLHDHGPLSAIAQRTDRKVCILYLYEPGQPREPSVHGSHIAFFNEGLLDLDPIISKHPTPVAFQCHIVTDIEYLGGPEYCYYKS
jgi:deoxyribodipyrimidine photolyase